ncbi:NAD(P)H-hydrate dehydratase [Breoghania sp.]|uniref:NAD(P)H-hydrate dehydratase n=1 Tax=Breoghania sp. TaxID=2065378 RepID=UPI002AA713E8|nr:NAD(P)H-hydrate dehydratase [Breoghania sp.]
MRQVLSVAQMGEADRRTIAAGVPGIDLMEAAGCGVADEICADHGPECRVLVLAGPGNNGGDGFVVARLLVERGYEVVVGLLVAPERLKGDALVAFDRLSGETAPVQVAQVHQADVIVDALFGAGLDRPLAGSIVELVEAVNARRRAGARVVAVDLPSGVSGDTGAILANAAGGIAIEADVTVTFCRLKPGHLLFPGRALSGDVRVVDIGIPDRVVEDVVGAVPPLSLNGPDLWRAAWRVPGARDHKYMRGHVVVAGGPVHATGAARLSAGAALRIGAGLVTLASPSQAVAVNAAHLTAVMIRPVDDADGFSALLADERLNAVVAGPGFGVGEAMRALVLAVLSGESARRAVVLDADALTSFADDPKALFGAIRASRCRDVVLTPHEGEFSRLFPEFSDTSLSRVWRAREAARISGAAVLLKGADTVVADPDGRATICNNAQGWLASAGSGDVLSGIIAGLLAQGLDGFEAAAMGAWCHGEAGRVAGPGLIAEDLAPSLRPVIARLAADCDSRSKDN